MSHSPCPTCCDIYAEQLTVTFMLNNDTPVVLHCPALDSQKPAGEYPEFPIRGMPHKPVESREPVFVALSIFSI